MKNLIRLGDILKEKGITSKDLADKIGVYPTFVSEVINGRRFPRKEKLMDIAEALDIDIRDLFHSSRANNPYDALREIRSIADRAVMYEPAIVNIGALRLNDKQLQDIIEHATQIRRFFTLIVSVQEVTEEVVFVMAKQLKPFHKNIMPKKKIIETTTRLFEPFAGGRQVVVEAVEYKPE